MKPIKQIAKSLKITERAVSSRFNLLGIKGKKRITTFYYTDEQIQKISFKKHKNPSYPLLSNPVYYQKQVDIIETYLYLDYKSASEVSRILKLPLSICERAVKYFNERNCIIIQSKINTKDFKDTFEQDKFNEFKLRTYTR